jgi:hypothetical protein
VSAPVKTSYPEFSAGTASSLLGVGWPLGWLLRSCVRDDDARRSQRTQPSIRVADPRARYRVCRDATTRHRAWELSWPLAVLLPLALQRLGRTSEHCIGQKGAAAAHKRGEVVRRTQHLYKNHYSAEYPPPIGLQARVVYLSAASCSPSSRWSEVRRHRGPRPTESARSNDR